MNVRVCQNTNFPRYNTHFSINYVFTRKKWQFFYLFIYVFISNQDTWISVRSTTDNIVLNIVYKFHGYRTNSFWEKCVEAISPEATRIYRSESIFKESTLKKNAVQNKMSENLELLYPLKEHTLVLLKKKQRKRRNINHKKNDLSYRRRPHNGRPYAAKTKHCYY